MNSTNITNIYNNSINPFIIASICLSPYIAYCLCCLCICFGVKINLSRPRQIHQKPNNNKELFIETLNKTTKLFNIIELNEINTIKECSICIDEYKIGDIIRQLKCSHTFHQGCIDEWILCNNICPNCRIFIY